MLVIMKEQATAPDLQRIVDRVEDAGGTAECHKPSETVIVINGCPPSLEDEIRALPGVASVRRKATGLWLVSRERQPQDTVVEVMGRRIGGSNPPAVIAGPCAVESEDQLFQIAEQVQKAGAGLLRGGAYKPRTSPYSFQGLGERGLELLAKVRERFGIPIVTELRDISALDLLLVYEVDVIQVGARSMQNFEILKEVGRAGKPVLLKRGPANSIDEWLNAAEYIMLEGNPQVILCERGIVSAKHSKTRYLLDLAAVPIVQELSHLPVIIDPSHAAGDRRWVPPMARAGVAAGANGLLIEVHHAAELALCDGPQSISPETFRQLMQDLRRRGYIREPMSVPGENVVRLATVVH
ncbi:MAG: 3-deoxy-7-phosphoheptulonate synthase [Thermoanaerobaculia bacterium]